MSEKDQKKERIVQANKVFCAESEKQGLKICSWENMPSWNSFVNGQINEDQLREQAQQEIAQFTQTFTKYTVVKKDTSVEDAKNEKAKKAKAANKIYKKACSDSGKSTCFFKNFTTWQEFVEGRIGDGELYEKAVEEVQNLVENPGQ